MEQQRRRRWLVVAMALGMALVGLAVWPSGVAGQAGVPGASVLDGVYTGEQAERGEALFGRHCNSCHNTSQFTGRVFQLPWADRTVFDFYDFVSSSMPESAPGSLSPQEYVDVVAYVLDFNGYPEGDAELAVEPDGLRDIRIEPVP